jgi:cation-transporting ATPase 13A2
MCIMMYRFGLIVGDYQYLIQDLFFTLVLGVVISMTPPTKTLSKELPPKRFLHPYLLAKLLVQIIIFMSFQLIALKALQNQPWYTPTHSKEPLTNTYSWEATVINNMALFQLMIASIVSTIGPPFRESWTTNPYHVGVLCLQFAWVMFQVFGDPNGDNKFMEDKNGLALKPVPAKFGLILTALMFVNLLFSCLGSYLTEYVRKITLQKLVESDKDK